MGCNLEGPVIDVSLDLGVGGVAAHQALDTEHGVDGVHRGLRSFETVREGAGSWTERLVVSFMTPDDKSRKVSC